MLDDFLVRAALAGVGVALAAGPLGCFVLWRRMAYFSDATAHGALCGVALSLVLNLPIAVGVLFIALALALLLSNMSGRMAADGFLGVFAHGSLAFGLLAVATVPSARGGSIGLPPGRHPCGGAARSHLNLGGGCGGASGAILAVVIAVDGNTGP